MSSLRMTSMIYSSNTGSERHQGDVACLFNCLAQALLMGGAHTRDAAGRDLATLGDKAAEQLCILVVDIVHFVYAKATDLFTPEILLFASGNRLVAAGGALRGRNRAAASLFCHENVLLLSLNPYSAGAGGAGAAGAAGTAEPGAPGT